MWPGGPSRTRADSPGDPAPPRLGVCDVCSPKPAHGRPRSRAVSHLVNDTIRNAASRGLPTATRSSTTQALGRRAAATGGAWPSGDWPSGEARPRTATRRFSPYVRTAPVCHQRPRDGARREEGDSRGTRAQCGAGARRGSAPVSPRVHAPRHPLEVGLGRREAHTLGTWAAAHTGPSEQLLTGARDATHVPEEARAGLGAPPCDSKDREALSLPRSVRSRSHLSVSTPQGVPRQRKRRANLAARGGGTGDRPAVCCRGPCAQQPRHGGLGLVCGKAGLAWAPPLTLCAAGHRMPRQASGRGADRPAGPRVSTTQTGGCTFPAKGAGLLGPRRSPGGSACGLSPDAGRLPPPQRTTLTGDRHRTVLEVTLRSHGPFRAMRVSRRIRTRQAAGLSGLLRRIFSL